MLCEEDGDTPGLRELVINGYFYHSGLAAWRGLLVNLQKLIFYTDEIREEDVETLGSISGLEYLCIHLFDAPDDPDELKAPLERAMNAHPNRPKLVWIDEE
jgi:disease resistance protein RPM1